MKKSLRLVGASVAALALALVPAVAANAASSQVATITATLDYQYGTAASPDGTIQAIADYGNDTVTLAYTADNTAVIVTDTNSDISGPMSVAFSPDGTTLYVSNYGSDTVAVVDVAAEAVVDTVVTPNSENLAVGVSPDGTKLVVGDDYDYVTVYDISNSYNQLGSNSTQGGYSTSIFFVDNSTAYVVDYDGYIDVVNLSDGTVTDSYGAGGLSSYGQCMLPDMSSVIFATDSAELVFMDPTTGDIQQTVDVTASDADASNTGFCSVTSQGYIVVSDWGRNGSNDDAYMYIYNGYTKTYIETVDLTGITYSDGINVMADCKVFVDGYYEDIAVVQLESSYCTAPELPNTGVDASAMAIAASVALGLVALGSVALVALRRRATH